MADPRALALHDLAHELTALATELVGALSDVKGAAGPMTWQGPAAEAFWREATERQFALLDLVRELRQASNHALDRLADVLAASPGDMSGPGPN